MESYNKWTGLLLSRKVNSILHSYTYDRAGNLTQETWSGNTRTYQYDALNQLRSVRHNGTLIVRYGYDVLGRRITKRVYSSITGGTVGLTRYKYHGSHVAFETDSAGSNIGWRYTWGMGTDDLLALRDAAGNHYYTAKDKLGSIRALAERDGTWKYSASYGPYGEPDTESGTDPGLRYRWTGREYDPETGWYFHRTRYYAPNMLRFVQEDKIGYGGGANLYAYVAGAVLDARDPSGMFMLYEWLTDPEANCGLAFCLGIDGTPVDDGGAGGGRGMIDSNNDGRDDFQDLTNYVWGWTQYRQNGGTKEQYQAIVFAIDHGFPDNASSGPAREALKFGRIRPGILPPGAYAGFDERTEMIIISTAPIRGVGDVSFFATRNFAFQAFLLSHELWHFAAYLHAYPPYRAIRTQFGMVDPDSERKANCYAQFITLYSPGNVYYPCGD